MCLFIAFAIMDQPETFQALLDMLGSFHGISMTGDDVVALGKKVLSAERDFNTRAGFTKHHDRLPRFFYNEPIAPHNQTFMMTYGDGVGDINIRALLAFLADNKIPSIEPYRRWGYAIRRPRCASRPRWRTQRARLPR